MAEEKVVKMVHLLAEMWAAWTVWRKAASMAVNWVLRTVAMMVESLAAKMAAQ